MSSGNPAVVVVQHISLAVSVEVKKNEYKGHVARARRGGRLICV